MTCTLCHARIVYRGNWPACDCDADPAMLLTVRDAARFLSMSRGGVYHLIYDGYLPADRSLRPMLIPMITVKAYLAAEHAEWVQQQAAKQAGRL
jgi:excisionase family DNA binding protein